jgi:hypothetical protein
MNRKLKETNDKINSHRTNNRNARANSKHSTLETKRNDVRNIRNQSFNNERKRAEDSKNYLLKNKLTTMNVRN